MSTSPVSGEPLFSLCLSLFLCPSWDSVSFSLSALAHLCHVSLNKKFKQSKMGVPGWLSQVSDFGSGHDLRVHEFEPHIELSVVSAEPTSDFLSPSLSLPLLCLHVLSLSLSKMNKH